MRVPARARARARSRSRARARARARSRSRARARAHVCMLYVIQKWNLHPGVMSTVPASQKKRVDIIVRLAKAVFKAALKDKGSREYESLENNMEDAVSYIQGYIALTIFVFRTLTPCN